MAIVYRVYSNQGAGGTVNYSSPVATTSGLAFTPEPIDLSTDTTFVVRAYDTVLDMEEANTESRVRLIIGPDGTEVTGRPDPPHAMSLSAALGGGRVSWGQAPGALLTRPDGFRVTLTAGDSPKDSMVSGSVPYVPGRLGYSFLFAGPLVPGRYTAAVNSFNSSGESAQATFSGYLGVEGEPFVMEGLTAHVIS